MRSKKSTRREPLSEQAIDERVVSEADDETAWEAPVRVHPSMPSSFSIPAGLAARAAFVARLHRVGEVEKWLTRIIRERVELEENAFAEAKREIAGR